MTVTQLTGIKVTHYALSDEHSPWKMKKLPPTSHLSHDGSKTVVEDIIKYVFNDLEAKNDFRNEELPFEDVMSRLEAVVQSSLTTQVAETSPDTQAYTTDTMFDHVKRWVNHAFPDRSDTHSNASINSREELMVLILTATEYVFQVAVTDVYKHTNRRDSVPIEESNPLPDKHDYITPQLTAQ